MMTNSSASSSEGAGSASFGLLHPKIQRWVWDAGWEELKDAQERAIPVIIDGTHDIVIAAATASGKTEAAFLPILSVLLEREERSSVIYIGPLKALINDQWGRLDALCERLDIPVVPWHGDVADSRKKRFLKSPDGVLLITPESLEALLMNHGHGLGGIFAGLRFIVVDELHAFIGTERGRQLQSLMHRIETVVKRRVPRIGLSATLGDMGLAAEFLRPGGGAELIFSRDGGQELKVIVKGYLDKPPMLKGKEIVSHEGEEGMDAPGEEAENLAFKAIGEDLFKALRGANHLVFPNSRGQVESYADLLRRRCEADGFPNEFWPHHGSLSKEIREEAEAALKSRERPATAICTTTLELGIDIGSVKSVAQIGAAPTVAGLRQRLGRSGRRKGEPAILRCYCTEREITPNTPLDDRLRHRLVLAAAQIRLLVGGWCEPPRPDGLHLSTLIQQLLSAIAQYGGLTAQDAWRLLCADGPFANLSQREFAELLRGLAGRRVLMQEARGLLLHGPIGEQLTGHYSFYAAFASGDEYRLVCGSRTLGSIPVSRPLEPGSHVIFAGRRWRVQSVDMEKRVIEVNPDKGGRAPLFDGMGGKVHDRVRQEMRAVLAEGHPVPFLDKCADGLLAEARCEFRRLGLDRESVVGGGAELHAFLWKGDWIQDTVALMLSTRGLDALNLGLSIWVHGLPVGDWRGLCQEIVANPPSEAELMQHVVNQQQEKWDFLLPDDLLVRNYVSHNLDIKGAMDVLEAFA